ncbi:MAG: VOC family protein [Anaerolineae bacterium]|nr:VOC family protein [Anaerolineae bacterium]
MSLELYMVGVIVEDMSRAVEFYRRLGVDVPAGSESKGHVEVKMSGLTFFLTTKAVNRRWDPAKTEPDKGGYRIILEFYLKTVEAVDQKYAEMTGFGYVGHQPPFKPNADLYFAMIDDPDGNTILLSAFTGDQA